MGLEGEGWLSLRLSVDGIGGREGRVWVKSSKSKSKSFQFQEKEAVGSLEAPALLSASTVAPFGSRAPRRQQTNPRLSPYVL